MLQLDRFNPSKLPGLFPALFPQRLKLPRRILLVNGHPDPRPERYCAALCEAYSDGAAAGGWEVRRLDVGKMVTDRPGVDLDMACEAIAWATQLMVIFPLWLEKPPPGLNQLFEEYHRREVAMSEPVTNRLARCLVTMEMPAFLHRNAPPRGASFLDASAALPGLFRQEREYIGSLTTMSPWARIDWLNTVHGYGMQAR